MRHWFRIAVSIALLVAASGAGAITWSVPTPVDLDGILLSDAAGVPRPLADIAPGAPVIIHFWATWCVPCRQELPAVDRFRRRLVESGLGDRLIVVSVDRLAHERVATFLRDDLALADLHAWQVTEGMPGTAFQLLGYPATVLVDAQHRLIARQSGPLDWDDPAVRAALIRRLRPAE